MFNTSDDYIPILTSLLTCLLAHTDSIWSVAWTSQDQVYSASADGTLKQWNPTSGQISNSQPPHTLGIVSLSTDASGKKVLWNTLEGLTSLWDLESGDVSGKWESYVRGSEGGEPGKSKWYLLI